MERIKGGYVILARKIDDSDISRKPPHFREIFIWLCRQANHQISTNGKIKRGQCYRTIKDIQEGLAWYVGYRKHTYTKDECEKALKYLRKATMIATVKATRGMLVTICNYDFYQDPVNYESNTRATMKVLRKQHESPTINKNDKNDKNEKKKIYISFGEFVKLSQDEYEKLVEKEGKEFISACIERLDNYIGSTGKRYKSHYRTILNWVMEAELKTKKWKEK